MSTGRASSGLHVVSKLIDIIRNDNIEKDERVVWTGRERALFWSESGGWRMPLCLGHIASVGTTTILHPHR
jgi:hypothetical protein